MEATREVLGRKFDYLGYGCKVVPFVRESVSLPKLGSKPVALSTVLGDRYSSVLSPGVLLRGSDDPHSPPLSFITYNPLRCYHDEVFRSNPASYRAFVAELVLLGMVRFFRTPRARVTPFFVVVNEGKQRVERDCRQGNI